MDDTKTEIRNLTPPGNSVHEPLYVRVMEDGSLYLTTSGQEACWLSREEAINLAIALNDKFNLATIADGKTGRERPAEASVPG